MLCQGQPDGWESCIMLESGLTHSLIVKVLQRSLLAVCEFSATSEECCERGYEEVCAKLFWHMLWHVKYIRMIAAMYVSSVDPLSIHFTRI